MKTTKRLINLISILICITFLPSNYLLAQVTVIIDTLAYTQISNVTDIRLTSRIRTSAEGTKLIFTGNDKMVYTMYADGSQLKQVFDYATFRGGCPCIALFIDISGDGSTILWTDGINEIFTANFDGSNEREIATLIPREPPLADAEPKIPVPPRLTYDGSKVFFFNVAGGKDKAGLYTIGSDGSELTKIFSYTDMSQNVFGMDGSEFNYNSAFTNYLDISDDGSRGIFATHNIDISAGHMIAFENSTLSLLRNYGPLFTNKPTGIGQFSISRDGNRVAIPFRDGSSSVEKIHIMDFNGENQVELPYIFTTNATFQLDSTGANILSTYHDPEFGGSDPFPISIINVDSSKILDLTLLEGNPQFNFRDARSPVLNYNAKTVFFINGIVREDSLEQIWKLDINPDTLIDHPTISEVGFSPNYVLSDASNHSTITASVTPGKGNILYVNWDTFMEGCYVFRGLGTNGIFENLVDDGTSGDVIAGDRIYTRNDVCRDLLEPPAVLTIRIHADAGKYITSVDAIPFFVKDQTEVSIEENTKQSILNKYELHANFPNPFNTSTKIQYSIPNSNFVTLSIYDILGRKIETLVSKFQNADTYSIDFDARNLSNGIYFCKLQAGNDFVETKKMLLIK